MNKTPSWRRAVNTPLVWETASEPQIQEERKLKKEVSQSSYKFSDNDLYRFPKPLDV